MTQPPSGAQTPPQLRISDDDRIARLQLLRSPRVGPATYSRLMAAHGTAAEALKALPDLARSKGVKSYQLCSEHMAQREYFTGKKIGADLIFEHEAGYPRLLAEISDAPPFLWVLGQHEQLTRPCVAVVGARAPTTATQGRVSCSCCPKTQRKGGASEISANRRG